MGKDIFIPTLDESQNNVLTDDIDKISYIIGFSLINPGFTSNIYEDIMLSLSNIIAKYPDDIDSVIDEYQNKLQAIITDHCDSEYIVSVGVVPDEDNDTANTIKITVTDSSGVNVLSESKMLDVLKK